MIVVVDERELVKDGYTSLFGREGIPSTGFDPVEFGEWVSTAAESDLAAVQSSGRDLHRAARRGRGGGGALGAPRSAPTLSGRAPHSDPAHGINSFRIMEFPRRRGAAPPLI